MKVFIATMLIAITLGEAYSQDRNRRRGSSDRGSRVERNRGSGNSSARRANRSTRRDDRASSRRSARRADRGTTTRRDTRTSTRRDSRTVTRRADRRADRVARRNDRVTRNNPGRVTRPGRTVRPGPGRVTRPNRTARRIRRYHPRPSRNHYGSRNYHRPYRYVYRPYRGYRHAPIARRYRSHRRYNSRYDYYNYVRRNYRSHIYLNWVLFPSSRLNGYYYVDNYPYYVHNGYRHRYSYEDVCKYQLVDKYTHQVLRSNYPSLCARGYDACAYDRDSYNASVRENRYFCAETIHGDNYNYSTPTYDYDEYEYDYDYGIDNYNTGRTTCYDYDARTGICYDN